MVKKVRKQKERKPAQRPGPAGKEDPRLRRYRVAGLFFLVSGFFLFVAFISWLLSWKADFQFADTVFKHFSFGYFFDTSYHIENWMGRFGALAAYLFINRWFGVTSLLIVFLALLAGIRLFFHTSLMPARSALGYALFGILWLPVFLGLVFPGYDLLSGIYGYLLNIWLYVFFGTTGWILLLAFTGLSFSILLFNIPSRWIRPIQRREKRPKEEEKSEPLASPQPGNTRITEPEVLFEEPEALPEEKPEETFLPPVPHSDIELQIERPAESTEQTGKTEPERFGPDTLYDPTLELPHYKFPPLSLLDDYGSDSLKVNKDELEANKNRIVETLNNYDIRIQKIKATIGPAVTLYEIVPEAGIRISRIKNLEDDIALSLAALGIRIIAPIPGRGTIGIEVPNQHPEIVSIKSMLASEKFRSSTFELPFALGKTISNETFIADLTKMPHLLLAGATGQGKSVGLNAIITSFLYKKHPATVKFVLIDPKKVELTLYSKIERHFLAKLPDSDDAIITDPKKVIRTLNSLNIEMDSRYDLLRDAQVRNIKEYNEKFLNRKLNPNEGHKFLPYIVLVIDEFADLIMTAGREIETPLTRLAQLARATGIHLIIATQRPSVNIITGTIKANFPARIAFRVISKIDSRTILDGSGADQLIGRGDMLLSTGSDLIRLQCAFVDTPEVEKVTEYIGSQRGYPDAFDLPEYYDEENGSGKEFDPNERDEMFAEAARLVVQHQHGSTSLIQRKLKLGYNRAGRIIDQLEAAGIVGSFEGSKAREVKFRDLNALEDYLTGLN